MPQTAYLISYGQRELKKGGREARDRLDNARQVPVGTLQLPEIKCKKWLVPPDDICAQYSGTSEVVKRHVLKEPLARPTLDWAMNSFLHAFSQGHKNVLLMVSCLSGTHRSVSVVELLKQHLQRLGYHIEVRHPHRPWLPGDSHNHPSSTQNQQQRSMQHLRRFSVGPHLGHEHGHGNSHLHRHEHHRHIGVEGKH